MQNKALVYVCLKDGDILPDLGGMKLFKAIVVIEDDVSQMWQWEVSRWLVRSGCRYMMAWGKEPSSWDDSVDEANLEAFDYEDIPDTEFIMTTWHDDEELSEVFWFSKNSAGHPVYVLSETVILHISHTDKERQLKDLYATA